MPQTLKLAVSQSRTLSTLKETLASLEATTRQAASQGVDLILFPEAFLGGYPRTCAFGAAVGQRTDDGREQFLQYFKGAVDMGDTPLGGGDDWVERKLPLAKGQDRRGDGTREFLERVAKETGVFVVTGLVERSGGSLYCAVVYVCPKLGCLGKRRKVMPTGSERLVWAQGSPSTLRAVTTTIKGVKLRLAAAICWENMMPLLRYSLYSQNVNLWLAPTADARPTWWPLMRTIGSEGRCFVLSAISCVSRKNLPYWADGAVPSLTAVGEVDGINGVKDSSPAPASRHVRRRSTVTVQAGNHDLVLPSTEEESAVLSPAPSAPAALKPTKNSVGDEFACRGGSCIAGPMGQDLVEPLWEVEDGGLLVYDADFEDCERGRLDLDVAGHYSRNDAFKLTVEGLDITPAS
ncbi:carbon-nitrogen hydrolase [Neohortaea acidophila]|uniref:Carbon-nitrogen hydrolase n=1 Tax=Neohortaea acidophila TaxID=245834 RepID=A0A6A6PZS8_9PEZI|nr:carbon-nitrogen hydrolase [Neohortaea acidophila]KAF2485650.1 carbon-nitrogen hydrolase [Neohortaea acidophila]